MGPVPFYPAPMRSFSLGVLALAVAATGCPPSPDSQDSLSRGQSRLLPVFEEASQSSGVPVDLLLAVAHVETRFSQRDGTPSRMNGYGMLHLRDGSTLQLGAAAAGVSEDAVKTDARANILAGAAGLAALARARGEGGPDLAGWSGTLEEWSGQARQAARYSAAVLAILRTGASGVDDEGATIVLPPHPELDLGPELGTLEQALKPDYPDAIWIGDNCNSSSRNGTAIDLVIVHTCQGGFTGCVNWSCNPVNTNVSTHYVVSSGGEVDQIVEEYLKAWHASCVNSRSIGIEHEGFVEDPARWYTEQMYCASAKLIRNLCDRHGIPCDRSHVIGHVEANQLYCSPGHTDPGSGWDWGKLMNYIANGCGGPVEQPGGPATGPAVGALTVLGPASFYVPVGPARLFDTRDAASRAKLDPGASFDSAGRLMGQTSATFSSWTAAGVPAGSRAVLLNAVLVDSTAAGFMSVYPAGSSVPGTSNVNHPGGAAALANAAVSPLGTGGGVSFFVNASSHVIADLSGRFAEEGLGLRPLTAVRVLDTRDTEIPVAAATPTRIDVSAHAAAAGAASVVLGIISPAGPGFALAAPCSSIGSVGVSSVNFGAGELRANLATTTLESGAFCVQSNVQTHLTVDLVGAWEADATLALVPVQPLRLLDTRDATGGWLGRTNAGQEVQVSVGSVAGMPASATAAMLNFTVTSVDGPGYLTAYPCGSARPFISQLTYNAGATVGALTPVSLGAGGKVCVVTSGRAHLIADLQGVFEPKARPIPPDAGAPGPDAATPPGPDAARPPGPDAGRKDAATVADEDASSPEADAGSVSKADAAAPSTADGGTLSARDAGGSAPPAGGCGCQSSAGGLASVLAGLSLPLLSRRRLRRP